MGFSSYSHPVDWGVCVVKDLYNCIWKLWCPSPPGGLTGNNVELSRGTMLLGEYPKYLVWLCPISSLTTQAKSNGKGALL